MRPNFRPKENDYFVKRTMLAGLSPTNRELRSVGLKNREHLSRFEENVKYTEKISC